MQVRNLVATCLSRLYAAGDMLPLFSSVYALQTFLQDTKSTATEVSGITSAATTTIIRLGQNTESAEAKEVMLTAEQ
jgi:hypothetical protein